MDESTNSPAEVNSIACLNKKRKSQNEPLEMPLPKHVCWSRRLGLNQIESDKFSREVESDPDSAKDSNSFQCNLDSTMSTYDETKTDHGYFIRRASNEPSTSSTSCAGTSLESRSLTASRSSGPGPDCPHCQYALQNSPSGYEGRFVEFDCSCSEYRNDDMENCRDNEIENMLFSNGIAPILGTDTQQEGKKLTIDKEFEQYFSMLML
ncbi:hypothetical protein DH2020_015088 [Rehmannia glutinosa]|uniref:Uncharacterized protein n=1 Tax=Rehmannia glutinosa TaxID=99300 RepID=A0ABR0WYB3_REHGL